MATIVFRWVTVASVVGLAACGSDPVGGLPDGSIPSGPGAPVIDSRPASVTNETHAVFTFHADGAEAFTCAIDRIVAPCASPVTFDVLDGKHVFEVGVGAHDHTDDSFTPFSWTVDTMPPETRIDAGPALVDNSATESISFSANELSVFACSLDGGTFAECTSPTQITPGDGKHTFAVRASDRASNADPTPATIAWTLDTTIVDTEITSGPANGAVVATSVSFAFTASFSPATFECAFDGDALAACTSPASRVLAGGSHHFTVRAKDSLGSIEPTPATRTFTVDSTPPVVTITAHPGNPSNVTSPTFAFTVSESGATTECRLDSGSFAACTSPVTTMALADGAHEFSIRATDTVGNQGNSISYDWTVDSAAPTVTITSGPTGPTADATPTFEFVVSGASAKCRIDSGTSSPCTSPFTAPTLSDGAHELAVSAVDAAGNVGSDARVFSVDTTGPTVIFDSRPPISWGLSYFDFTFHGEAGATFECALGAVAFTPCESPFTLTVPVHGTYTLSVRAKDALGNVGAPATASWSYDGSPVMHVAFDGNSPADTALAVPGYAPPPSVTTVPSVGGRAGLAARSPSYRYVGSKRSLSTAPDHKMFVYLWIRPLANASGVIWSNASASDGITLSWINGGLRASLLHGGSEDHLDVPAVTNEWHQVVVVSRNAGDGAELYVDAVLRGVVGAGSGATGFDANQADDLAIGPMSDIDVDDLYIYAGVPLYAFICAGLGGGEADTTTNTCTNLPRPVYELSFEGDFANTGTFHLPVSVPESSRFIDDQLGTAVELLAPATNFSLSGFGSAAANMTERTFTFSAELDSNASDDVLLDFMSGGSPASGGRVTYLKAQKQLRFTFTTTTGDTQTATVPATASRFHVAIVEHLAGGSTASVNIYVNAISAPAATLAFGSGALVTAANDRIGFASNAHSIIDEVRLWPRDLSTSLATLCRLGFGGHLFAGTSCLVP